jgi:hypothetical protein
LPVRLELVGLDLEDVLLRAAREGARLALAERTPSPWMNAAEVAEYVGGGVTEQAVRDAERHGHIKAHRSNDGKVRFHVDDVERYVTGEMGEST